MVIKEIIANNIVSLRKAKKWTQTELAEKLNYTDKAISKWERAESMPDVDSLYSLSCIFNVTVDYFFHDNSLDKDKYIKKDRNLLIKKILILILVCVAIFSVSQVLFLIGSFNESFGLERWLYYIFAIPFCCLACSIFFSIEKIWLGKAISSSLLIWTTLISIFLPLRNVTGKMWMIMLIGIPVQAAVLLFLFISRIKKNKI